MSDLKTQLKQPHEGITGSPLTDDLLSLDETAVAHRDALVGMARLLHGACLVGNPAPVVSKIYDRMTKPRPGDMVVEMSAMHSRDVSKRAKGLGILIETREEWYETDEEWAASIAEGAVYADESRLTDTAWYIQYGPAEADICRWVNCKFIALPYADHSDYREEWRP